MFVPYSLIFESDVENYSSLPIFSTSLTITQCEGTLTGMLGSRCGLMLFGLGPCKIQPLLCFYYRPQRSCGQGYVFTLVCDSVRRGGLPRCMLGYPPRSRHPPQSRHPHAREQTPPTPSIRSMSGRYASYRNAFLLLFTFISIGSMSHVLKTRPPPAKNRQQS